MDTTTTTSQEYECAGYPADTLHVDASEPCLEFTTTAGSETATVILSRDDEARLLALLLARSR